jgi:hypothetical protein
VAAVPAGWDLIGLKTEDGSQSSIKKVVEGISRREGALAGHAIPAIGQRKDRL